MKESEILEKAADVINERGWTQGREVDRTGAVCLRGALRMAAGATIDLKWYGADGVHPFMTGPEHPRPSEYTRAIERVMGLLEHEVINLMPAWNDEQGRTKDEVITVLQHAAKLAKEDEDETI